MGNIIVWATPVFLGMIAAEWAWSRTRWSRTRQALGQSAPYTLADSVNSLSLGLLSQLTGVVLRAWNIAAYALLLGALPWAPALERWWFHPLGWVLALVLYDLCYYWHHRLGHTVAFFWASHAVHHQSQHYNLSTALRQTSGSVLGWVFYLPLALLGVPLEVFVVVALIDLLYQFWVHTEQVGRLGWFDRWFCSPSNHRVHHAVNDRYLDKNYGGIFMLWDHLFGSFVDEDAAEACVYGTRSPLKSWDPLWANLQVYAQLWQASRRATHWRDALAVGLQSPGWQSAAMARTQPAKAFALDDARARYAPPLSGTQYVAAGLQFLALLAAGAYFLWHAGAMPWAQASLWVLALALPLWALGRFLQSQWAVWELLMFDSACLAILSSVGWVAQPLWWKPLPLAFAIIFVATQAYSTRATGQKHRQNPWLLAALACSWLGDVLLMLPGDHFIPGLLAFLCAHLAYWSMLRQGLGAQKRPQARAFAAPLGAATLLVLWVAPGIAQPVLLGAVLLYALVIALMASQALQRALVWPTPANRTVAWGAGLFMLSDALIAVNRFSQPLPWAPYWILLSYFLAQWLIVHHTVAQWGPPQKR